MGTVRCQVLRAGKQWIRDIAGRGKSARVEGQTRDVRAITAEDEIIVCFTGRRGLQRRAPTVTNRRLGLPWLASWDALQTHGSAPQPCDDVRPWCFAVSPGNQAIRVRLPSAWSIS